MSQQSQQGKKFIDRLSWIGAITVIMILADLLTRILSQRYTEPVIYDSLVTLAVGFWFGKR